MLPLKGFIGGKTLVKLDKGRIGIVIDAGILDLLQSPLAVVAAVEQVRLGLSALHVKPLDADLLESLALLEVEGALVVKKDSVDGFLEVEAGKVPLGALYEGRLAAPLDWQGKTDARKLILAVAGKGVDEVVEVFVGSLGDGLVGS